MLTVKERLVVVHVPHLETEKVLFGDHGRDSITTKVVHREGLNVALSVTCFVDDNEAADLKLGYLDSELSVRNVFQFVVVPVTDESLK